MSSQFKCLALFAGLVIASSGCTTTASKSAWVKSWRADNKRWRGVHLTAGSDRQVDELIDEMAKLASVGVNVVVLEVNYSLDWQSHPELRPTQFVSKERAIKLVDEAHNYNIRLIPQLNCLGHQSWSKVTAPLLTKYPQFDETPGQYPENKDIYCRSWCPRNPEVNKVVFALIDELIDTFQADAFHVGMDEVFLVGSEFCPRCRGADPAQLFAQAVNDLHQHIVNKRGLEMLMWGDRLLDSKALGYSEWEAARNGTQGAVKLIPKDIIICDWHYGKQKDYPSVKFLLDEGFRVWPAGWQPVDASKAFSSFSRQINDPRLLGYLCTVWGKAKIPQVAEWPPVMDVLHDWE